MKVIIIPILVIISTLIMQSVIYVDMATSLNCTIMGKVHYCAWTTKTLRGAAYGAKGEVYNPAGEIVYWYASKGIVGYEPMTRKLKWTGSLDRQEIAIVTFIVSPGPCEMHANVWDDNPDSKEVDLANNRYSIQKGCRYFPIMKGY